jgi:hypothetical protein
MEKGKKYKELLGFFDPFQSDGLNNFSHGFSYDYHQFLVGILSRYGFKGINEHMSAEGDDGIWSTMRSSMKTAHTLIMNGVDQDDAVLVQMGVDVMDSIFYLAAELEETFERTRQERRIQASIKSVPNIADYRMAMK